MLLQSLWRKVIQEQLFADNSFLDDCQNWDEYVVQGILDVIIPQAGAPAGFERNRSVLPAVITRRTDSDIKYTMVDYTINPQLALELERIQLSYPKMESVVRQMVLNLKQGMAEDILYTWRPEINSSIIPTSGDVAKSALAGSTGNRKLLTLNDVIDANTLLDNQLIPSEGRVMMLTSAMYNNLMKDKDLKNNFNKDLADLSKGVLGELMGFKIKKRAKVSVIDNSGTVKLPGAAVSATDSEASLFWHPSFVGRSLGNIAMYMDAVVRPEYYGKTSSGQAQAGGTKVYASGIGVGAIMPMAA
jgi:Phage capsid protein